MEQEEQLNKESAIGITFVGFEDIAAQEISEILGKKITKITKITTGKGVVFFSATDYELAKLCYKTQALQHVLRLLKGFVIPKDFSSENFEKLSLENFKKECKKMFDTINISYLSSYLSEKSFSVTCCREGEHLFTSKDVAAIVGEVIGGLVPNAHVNLQKPDVPVFCFIRDEQSYFGIDFAGFELSKREYKIYNQTNTLNGAFAYCTVRFAGYTGKEVLLDPICGVGLIPIEAAIFATGVSPRYYQKDLFAFHRFLPSQINLSVFDSTNDEKRQKKIAITGYDVSLRNVEAAKKHAKLSGIEKNVTFGRADIEWIDTKINEKAVQIIVTQVPVEGRLISENDMKKFYKEFFYQLEFVLADNGKMVLLCQKTGLLKNALDYFEIVNEHKVWQGKQEFTIITLKKKK